MKLRTSLALAMMLAAQTIYAGSTDGPRFVERGYRVDSATQLGKAGIARIDLDGDGAAELVVNGQSSDSVAVIQGVLVVLSGAQGNYGVAGERLLADDGGLVQVLGWTSQDGPSILTVGANGTVRQYLGLRLEEVRQFAVASGGLRAIIGDADADGYDDLVILTPTALHVYALDDGRLLRSHAISGQSDIALAQLDADPALEIVLAGTAPGLVLDGATMATDWTYIDSFGLHVATGQLGTDGTTHWVGASPWNQFTVFRAWPWSPLWTGQVSQRIDSIAVSPIDNHSQDAVLIGETSGLYVFDSNTRQQLFRIQSTGSGLPSITSGDFDGDGHIEIAFASLSSFYPIPIFTIVSSGDGAVKWQLFPANGAFTAVAFGDVDGDGRQELVAASNPVNSQPGTIKIFDALSAEEKWRSPQPESNLNDPFYLSVAKVELMARSEGPGMDIVLAGMAGYDGRILVVDGVTKQHRLDIHSYSQGPLRMRRIKDLALLDYDGDQQKDLAVVTQPVLSDEQGVRVQVFSGVDGSLLWASPALGAWDAIANQLLIIGEDTDTSDVFLVAALPDSLRAFDRRTGLLAWTLAVPNDGAAFVPSGVVGGEIAVFTSAGSIGFYDATHRTLLRQLTLSGPMRSIRALGGSVQELLVAMEDQILLVDGETGLTRATSESISPFPASGVHLAALRSGEGVWDIASGTQIALYRHQLELSEDIFANGFDE